MCMCVVSTRRHYTRAYEYDNIENNTDDSGREKGGLADPVRSSIGSGPRCFNDDKDLSLFRSIYVRSGA